MITWIQKYFQKHFRLVFALILIAVAVPMVIVYSQSSTSFGRAGTKSLDRPFFNVNLGSDEQARRVFTDGNLSAQLKAGYAALQGGQLQQYSLQRIAGLALADELHLPAPTSDQVARYILTLRAFQDDKGVFDQKRYSEFGDKLKTGGGQVSTAEVTRVLRDDTRLSALSQVIGGPGFVVANDVRQELIRSDSSWTVQVATLDYAAFNPTIPASEEVLKKFYDDQIFRYEVPARPRLSYVEFKGADFIPPVAPTEAEIRAVYLANMASFPVPADPDKKDAPMALIPATPVDNFPKVRAQVETAMKNLAGARAASKAANDLTIALFERKLAANSPELGAFLASQRRPARPIAPFAPDNPPAGMDWLGNYADQISRLSQERHFSDPLPTPDSYVVLLWNESLPAYRPIFAEVHDRVAADYKEGEKRKLFIARGQALRAQLQAAAKTTAGFAGAAAAEKLEVKSYASFILRQPPQDIPYQALGTLQGLEAGQVSEMVAAADKGYIVYAQEKKLPDLSSANPRFVELQKQIMAFTASSNENSYLGELVERELKKSEPATP